MTILDGQITKFYIQPHQDTTEEGAGRMPETLTDRNRCHKCDKTNKRKFSKCGKCQSITYCSRDCQEEDWSRHEDNCIPVMVADRAC